MYLMKKALALLISIFIFFSINSRAFAENSPTPTPNNKFGIHVTDERDLVDAANLINSNGGDWGYVTLVITETDRNHDRWQQMFNQMRRLHLIPIVRIASRASGDNWEIPQEQEIENWVKFLNSLNWVIQNRYVVVGNEPNHSTEWGGKIDPTAYANYLNKFAEKLHQASGDFVVLPAGLDASASNTSNTMDELQFIRKMLMAEPSLFDNLDGWTSHSYPNPAFAGNVTDTGRGTIQTYNWELNFLRSMGVYKDLPVFITETGWSNKEINPEDVGSRYVYAFENVWNDKRIVAVTPFILNYTEEPFLEFSWKKKDNSFHPYYDAYKNIKKTKGDPIQVESGQIVGAFIQPVIVSGSDFIGAILVKNTGQSIWSTDNLKIISDNNSIVFKNNLFFDIEPMRTGLIVFKAKSEQETGILFNSIYISSIKDNRITNSFPVEALVTKANKVQIESFFARIVSYLRNIAKGP